MFNKVYIDSEGLLTIWVIGDQTEESVREMGEKLDFYARELQRSHKPILVLDNLLKMGHTTSAARAEVARIAKRLPFERAAMVGGGSPAMRFGTNLMLKAIGKRNLRFFASMEAATLWLEAGKPETARHPT
jgi:hypothetical protein